MRFDSRLLQLAKDPEHPAECQDACRHDASQGTAVLADGVTSAIFSRQWAGLLTDGVVAGAPEPCDAETFGTWLSGLRQAWSSQIDPNGLAWFQRAKMALGAFSTLLWVRVLPIDGDCPGAFGGDRLRAFAWGDTCLFQVRGKDLVRAFPLEKSADFQADPVVLGSIDLQRDHLAQFASLNEFCYPDDLLVLATDALAEWAMRRYEAGEPTPWEVFWDARPEDWQGYVAELREERQIRVDDTTLLLLRVQNEHAPHPEPPPLPQTLTTTAPPENPEPPPLPETGAAAESLEPNRASSPEPSRASDLTPEQVFEQIAQTSRSATSLPGKLLRRLRDTFRRK